MASLSFAQSPDRISPDRISFDMKRSYPASVVLTPQLPTSVHNELYGTCHIQAAVSAFNAACWRRTGVLFQTSVAYLFYRHYSDVLSGYGVLDLFLTDLKQGQFTENDAGDFAMSLDRIKSGSLMLESDFSMKNMTSAFQKALQVRAEFWSKAAVDRVGIQSQYEEKMKSILRIDLDISLRQAAGPRATKAQNGWEFKLASNPQYPLMACHTEELRVLVLTLNAERMVRLLNAGFPILCQFRQTPTNPKSGSHVTLISGYSYQSKTFQFLHRDSLLPNLLAQKSAVDCYRASVVYNLYEEKNLQLTL